MQIKECQERMRHLQNTLAQQFGPPPGMMGPGGPGMIGPGGPPGPHMMGPRGPAPGPNGPLGPPPPDMGPPAQVGRLLTFPFQFLPS